MDNESSLKEISIKLDTLIKLSALNLVKDGKTQKEQIVLLSGAGFQPKQIADILGTNNNVVSVTLASIKKKREEQEAKEKNVEDVTTSKVNENE